MMSRPALLLEVDGEPGIWLSAGVAELYGAVMATAIRSRVRGGRDAGRIRDDLLVTQSLLQLGSDTGTKLAGSKARGTSSGGCWAVLPLSVTDAAALAGISDRGIRKAITAGRLQARRVGRAWSVDPVALQQFLQRREVAA